MRHAPTPRTIIENIKYSMVMAPCRLRFLFIFEPPLVERIVFYMWSFLFRLGEWDCPKCNVVCNRTREHYSARYSFPVEKIKTENGALIQYWDVESAFRTFNNSVNFLEEESQDERNLDDYENHILYQGEILETSCNYT
jgi:hypothetical protein